MPSTTPGCVGAGAVATEFEPANVILGQLRQAEVENLDPVIPGHEDVLRLEIPVQDPLFVRRGEAVRYGKRILNRLADGDRARVHAFAKGLPFQQLRHDERRIGIGADVEDGEDVRVAQCRGRAGLLLEAVEAIDIGREDAGQDLDRDVTPEPRIACPVHLAHAACAERGHDLVGPEASARFQRQWSDGRL